MQPTVTHLFIKPNHGQKVVAQQTFTLIQHHGIENDVSANPLSPRQLLLISAETLKEFKLQPGDLKENIIIQNLDVDKLESGTSLQISQARIRITIPCEPCKYLLTVGLENPQQIKDKRGILAVVIQGGKIKLGDTVEIIDMQENYIPHTFVQRLAWITQKIPTGKVLSYKTLVTLAGGSQSYIRVIPQFISRNKNLPVHRIVDSTGNLIEHVLNQKELLVLENSISHDNHVDLQKYEWFPENLY